MKTLYIFPHPDDESFGPAPVMYRQIQNGEEVHLLTLTKGGATKQRFKYNFSIDEMGVEREKEMQSVKEVLQLTSMEVLDLEDGGLERMNPLEIEGILLQKIDAIKPNIIVTYPIHGISCHHDHLAIHGIVKRLFSALQQKPEYNFLKRLAFFTLPNLTETATDGGNANVRSTKLEHIDCIVELNKKEVDILRESLYCYTTFIDVIKETNVINHIGDKVYFQFYQESFEPKLGLISEKID